MTYGSDVVDKKKMEFPGTLPVALTMPRLRKMMKQPQDYVVSEKTDGVRYMLFVDNTHRVLLVDRTLKMYDTNVDCTALKATLLDGELVFDFEHGAYKYAVFDCTYSNGLSCRRQNWHKRMEAAEYAVSALSVLPFMVYIKQAVSVHELHKLRIDPVSVDDKNAHHHIYNWVDVRNAYVHRHHCDGLVFVPIDMPYVCLQNTRYYKWKDPRFITVDFVLQPRHSHSHQQQNKDDEIWLWYTESFCQRTQRYKQAAYRPVSCDVESQLGPREQWVGRVVECSFCEEDDWKPLRVRHDKDIPNNVRTVIDTLETIAQRLTMEALIMYTMAPLVESETEGVGAHK